MNITLNQSFIIIDNNYQIWKYTIILFSLWGILTNILVFILCLKNVRQHSYMWYIGNLALADFVTCVLAFILLQQDILIDNFACKLIPAIAVVSLGTGIGSQPLLAINRYVAIIRPDWYKSIFENSYIIAFLLLSNWALNTIFSITDFYSGCLERAAEARNGFVCFFNASPTQIECLLPKIIHFILCYVILGFCYLKILWALRRHQRQLDETDGNRGELAKGQQLLSLIALHGLAHIGIYTPALITVMILPTIRLRYHIIDQIALFSAILNPISDSLLTIFIVKIFRNSILMGIKKLKYFLTCRCRCHWSNESPTQTFDLKLLDNLLANDYRYSLEKRRERTL